MKFLHLSTTSTVLGAPSLPRPCFCGKGGKPRILTSIALMVVFGLMVSSCHAQTTPTQPAQTTPPAQQPDQPHQGTIIFSRSTDESGQTTTQTGQEAQPAIQVVAPKAQLPAPEVPPPQVETLLGATKPMRANSEPLAPPQVAQVAFTA